MRFLNEDGLRAVLSYLKTKLDSKLDTDARVADSAKLGGKTPEELLEGVVTTEEFDKTVGDIEKLLAAI